MDRHPLPYSHQSSSRSHHHHHQHFSPLPHYPHPHPHPQHSQSHHPPQSIPHPHHYHPYRHNAPQAHPHAPTHIAPHHILPPRQSSPSPRLVPSLTLQRPSQPSLPPLESIRPGSISDPPPSLSRHPRPRPRTTSRGSTSSQQPTSPGSNTLPPPPPRRTSSSALDLSRYAMTSNESDHSPSSLDLSFSPQSSNGARRPSMPFIKEEPRDRLQPPLTLSPRTHSHGDEPQLKSIDASDPIPTLPPIQRRSSGTIDRLPHLHISERDFETKPTVRRSSSGYLPGWQATYDRRDSDLSGYSSRSISSTSYCSDTRKLLQTMPIPHQSPITVFPVQYNWPPVEGITSPGPDAAGVNKSLTDPALSSVRSSAGGFGGDSAAAALVAPELRLPPETLDSASPAIDPDESKDDDFDGLAPPDSGMKKDAPFSRSPELRVSHKLAERKRRKEMRDLFDELREQLPADRGMKASKWEILSKAVDYIAHLKTENADARRTIELLHRDLATARGEPPNSSSWAPSFHFASLPYVPPHQGNSTNAAGSSTGAAPVGAGVAPTTTATAPVVTPISSAVPTQSVPPLAQPPTTS